MNNVRGTSRNRCGIILGAEVPSACQRKRRIALVMLVALLWTGVLVARLFSLQIADREHWREWALKQHSFEMTLASERGPIVDRQGRMLALSIPAQSLYVRTRHLRDRKAAEQQLSAVLNLDAEAIGKKLADPKPFVWLTRQIPRAQAEAVLALKIPGVGAVLEAKRVYPYGAAAAPLIGKVGTDGNGLAGIERLFEKALHGTEVRTRASRDALGNFIHADSRSFELPRGKALSLTVDAEIQMIVDEELERGRLAAKAASALALLVDAENGEILAMSQGLDFDPNSHQIRSSDALKNRVVEGSFEPGSILKPIVAAAALDAGVITADEIVDCERGRFPFGPHVIKDVHPSGAISFFDVVVRSSNIGMTKVGMRLGPERLFAALRDFGFGENTDLGLPGETQGILRPVESWAKVDVATHSFGQGIAVTPLQMVRAMAAIANGGRLPQLRIIEGESRSKRIISERSAELVREMLYGVVEDKHGTGTKAAIPGVRIGGKTGTAQKARKDGRGYETGAYIASFIGFADASSLGVRKSLTLLVSIDEPRSSSIYGGVLAAPVFKAIMERSLNVLAVKNRLGSGPEARPFYFEARNKGSIPTLSSFRSVQEHDA